MPVTVIRFEHADETRHGIRGDSDSRQVPYIVELSEPVPDEHSDEADAAVLSYAEANVPDHWDGCTRAPFQIEQITPRHYRVTAVFNRRDPRYLREPGTLSIKYTFGTETVRMYRALAQKHYPASAPNHQKFINVGMQNGKLKVEGVDIPVPTCRLEIRRTVEAAVLDTTYRYTLASLGGKVNNAVFNGHPVGEVLFEGAEYGISIRSGDNIEAETEVAYTFHIRQTPTLPLTLGGITIPAGEDIWGWDIIWAQWRPEAELTTTNDLIAGAAGLYASRVLESANFALLGLGLGPP